MKIAFLNIYSGINNRGAESFIHQLAERLSENNSISLFSGRSVSGIGKVKNVVAEMTAYQPQHEIPQNLLTALLKRLFIDRANLSVFLFTLKILPKIFRDDFKVLVPVNGFWQVIFCKLVSILKGSKVVVTGHSGPGWDERWNLYLKPDVFVATTPETKEWAKTICPWTRVEMVPYGIGLNSVRRRSKIQLPLPRPIYLCPAAAVPYKRIDLAIEAVSRLDKGSLLHLGAGPLEEELQKKGKASLGDRFMSLYVEHSEIPSYYQIADAVTLPSMVQENSPMVFLEAISFGKPVVATDTARNRWLIDEAGVLVDVNNLDEYSQALVRALRIPTAKIRNQAKKFSWETVVPEYERLLGSL